MKMMKTWRAPTRKPQAYTSKVIVSLKSKYNMKQEQQFSHTYLNKNMCRASVETNFMSLRNTHLIHSSISFCPLSREIFCMNHCPYERL